MATVALSGIITPTNVVTATSTTTLSNKTLVAPALGTPASGNLSNCTGIPAGSAATPTVEGTVYGKMTASGGTPYLTALGYNAAASTTGELCTAVGVEALYSNSTGQDCSAFGYRTLYANTSGNYNCSFGRGSLRFNTTGANLVGIGNSSLNGNTTGSNNTAVGVSALQSNTTASSNTAVGYQSLYSNTTGTVNDAFGQQALYACTTGLANSAFGYRALYALTTGEGNTACGNSAGIGITTGEGNGVFHVTNVNGNPAPVFSITSENNRIVIGTTDITNAYVQVAWTVVSDLRDKIVLGDVPLGLDFVRKLKPIKYQFKESRESNTPHGVIKYGFGAQDVLAEEGDNPVIVDTEVAEKLKITDSHMMPVFANAIKEMADIIDKLKAEFDAYKASHP